MRRLLYAALILAFVPSVAFAFIDTKSITDSLDNIEQELSGDSTGLSGLLNDLDKAAEESGAADSFLTFTIDGSNTTFWDVPKNAWFYSPVLALVELKIVSGKRDSNGNILGYDPGGYVSRPAALKMALLAAGVETSACGTPSRKDAIGHWAEAFVACAEKMDLGLGDKPLNEPASRAEVLHYVLKAFKINVTEGNPPFADSVSHIYKNDIAYAYAMDMISGDKNADGSPKGTFRPDDPINRAEVAKIIKLAIETL